jgi:protein ImuB
VLWIALHLPLLSLEAFAATLASAGEPDADATPIALMDAQRIVAVNAAAQALGVRPGLKRATALALAPQIVLGRADPRRDTEALAPVAHAALAYTPSVSIQPSAMPDEAAANTVLLEVEASLRCFGGKARLLQRLQAALRPLKHRFHVASAPTAQGAALLARVHARLHCADLAATRRALDAAPVWLLGPGREHWDTLQGMGLRTLGDLRSLPRSGLARRFGAPLLGELDRALGQAPDPRSPITLPPVFESRLELFARADSTEQVLHGAGVLLARLVAWLAAQHAFVRRFTLSMQHEARWRSEAPAVTCLEIALAEPSRDGAHLLVLLRERLARLQLPAPTLDLGLRADDIAHQPAPNRELFATAGSLREGLIQLIERLQARLGPEQVQRLQPVEDHRPECGSRSTAAAGDASSSAAPDASRKSPARQAGVARPRRLKPAAQRSAKAAAKLAPELRKVVGRGEVPEVIADIADEDGGIDGDDGDDGVDAAVVVADTAEPAPAGRAAQAGRPAVRPTWLLTEPEPLPERRSRPLLGGQPLQLLSGPERIEAGWWDSGLAERDYFIAQAADGALVWIYRARLPLSAGEGRQGWFMQGRFG